MSVAWAAGLYEGEGCADLQGRKPRMALGMVDRDVVERFAAIVGRGKIVTREPAPPRQRLYIWRVTSWEDVEAVAAMIAPYLGERRTEQLRRVLDGKPADLQVVNSRKTHCPRGHAYSGDNLRIARNGDRKCRACNRERQRARAA